MDYLSWLTSLAVLLNQLAPSHRPTYSQLVQPHTAYRVVVLRIIDADTVEVGVIVPARLRIRNVQAPERGTREGDQMTATVRAMLPHGCLAVMVVDSKDRYGRWVGDVCPEGGIWASLAIRLLGAPKYKNGGAR